MTQHTHGPWKYNTKSGAVFHDDGDFEPLIATVNFENASEEQSDADGYLIAAAPDLLAALKSVLPTYEREFPNGEGVIRIRAAVAKAEGR